MPNTRTLTKLFLLTAGALAMTILAIVVLTNTARAADLGGNCCADLEDRIAELEATTARKGNRKVSVTVYGVVNKAISHWSGDFPAGTAVGENSSDETYFGVRGAAAIGGGWSAGYVLEIGAGGYDAALKSGIGYGPVLGGDTNEIYTRQSFAYVKSEDLGKLSVGLTSQATDGIYEMTTANTRPAMRAGSLRPITGPQIFEALDLWDGTRANVIRYDSPFLMGAVLSASWTTGDVGPIDTDDVWDVALRWRGDAAGFEAVAGIGYRNGIVIPTIGALGAVGPIDPEIISGSASIKHTETGLFITGAAGKLDLGPVDVTSYELQGGIEKNWFGFGATTLFVDYADWGDLELEYVGAGIVQHFDDAGLDLYLTGRRYEFGDFDGTGILAGAKIQF